MKKLFSIFLALAMLFALCSCDAQEIREQLLPKAPEAEVVVQPVSTEPPAPAETPEPAPAAKEPTNRVIVTISKNVQEFYDPAEERQLILDFSYETPHVDILERDEAAAAINEYVSLLDETYCTGNDYGAGAGDGLNAMLELAIDNFTYAYETGTDVNLELSSNRRVSISRSDDSVLSLVYTTYVYKGGDKGETKTSSYVFDTESGDLLTLDMLAADRGAFDAAVLESMKAAAAADPVFSGVEGIDELLPGLLREGAWALTREGIEFVSDEHEFSQTVDGVFRAAVSYEQLAGLMDEKYLPVCGVEEGTVSVIPQADFQDGSMEVIDKVFVDNEGEDLCLVAEGTVYDVSLSRVGYTDFNGRFYQTRQLWNGSFMRDCVLQLRTMIPDGMPDLLLSYRTAAGEKVSRLITQSGEDGSIILIEDNIVAVG